MTNVRAVLFGILFFLLLKLGVTICSIYSNPNYYNEDISIIKRTNINERISVEFRADFLNMFNRVVFGFDQGGDQYGNVLQGNGIDSGIGSFGHILSQGNVPREIQFGLKVFY